MRNFSHFHIRILYIVQFALSHFAFYTCPGIGRRNQYKISSERRDIRAIIRDLLQITGGLAALGCSSLCRSRLQLLDLFSRLLFRWRGGPSRGPLTRASLVQCWYNVLLSTVGVSPTVRSGEQVFKNVIGTILSPNYPKHYGNNEYQYYRIIPPQLREIVLIFHDFDVETGYNCMYDYLEASIHFSDGQYKINKIDVEFIQFISSVSILVCINSTFILFILYLRIKVA